MVLQKQKVNFKKRIENILSRYNSDLKTDSGEDRLFKEFVYRFFLPFKKRLFDSLNDDQLYFITRNIFQFIKNKDPKERVIINSFNADDLEILSGRTILQICLPDMPFIMNSILSAINNSGYRVYEILHPIMHFMRDKKGNLEDIFDVDDKNRAESVIHLQITRIDSENERKKLEQLITDTLDLAKICVSDWQPILSKVSNIVKEIKSCEYCSNVENADEVIEFLNWLIDDNFVFLGLAKYNFTQKGKKYLIEQDERENLGIFRGKKEFMPAGLLSFNPEVVVENYSKNNIIEITKSLKKSVIHRPANMDYVGVKIYDKNGDIISEYRIIGLFASSVYYQSATQIPLIKDKIKYVLKKSGFRTDTHSGRALIFILQGYPRDELLQMSVDDLYGISQSLLELNERPSTRIFVRKDRFLRFVSCMIYVPRDFYNTDLRKKIQELLSKAFRARVTDYFSQVSESPLSRVHVILQLTPESTVDVDIEKIENELVEITSSWVKGLKYIINDSSKSTKNYSNYLEAFSDSYRTYYTPGSAFIDIAKIEEVYNDHQVSVHLYKEDEQSDGEFHLKIYTPSVQLTLSEILPILENTGFYTIDERNFEVRALNKGYSVWVNHFRLNFPQGQMCSLVDIKEDFEESLSSVWHGKVENDELNKLIILACLTWRHVAMLRGYMKYIVQIGFVYSAEFMAIVLASHPKAAKFLVDYFVAKFSPDTKENKRIGQVRNAVQNIEDYLNGVENITDDRVIRQFFETIRATLRTNFFQNREYISYKIKSGDVINMPLPKPHVEIFVYSYHFEGVHLRGGKVARGGLRWSDRKEDFRTEILGLVKAQMVKNSVIVPVGSKGGFVLKHPSQNREEFLGQGKKYYKRYLSGLLDVTDNIVDGKVVKPEKVYCYDEDDPYLVVAADKGTATFSDTANEIAKKYDFWLDDAFASGGSVGYDHKKMGITAKGAWVSVQRHFAEMGIDTQTEEFSVVGIGDMSGDVFGNGMLLSRKIKLIAAFNHIHIFIDPNPSDVEKSYKERERLFNLPSSAWTDYDKKLISKGGGIFSRSSKTIKLSTEIKERLNVKENELAPDELIKNILKAEVDLLWNGGIGTYVKSVDENNEAVGDKANDSCRINAHSLRCKVIGEGGNLGFTQKARIQYAAAGGRVNTDAIDNSAGVDCSDHEVNIKIALEKAVKSKKISLKKRNNVLDSMTDDVASLVLRDNLEQTLAITVAQNEGHKVLERKYRLIQQLENQGLLNSGIEFLPTHDEIERRYHNQEGYTRPEISVILAYSKLDTYSDLLSSNLPDDKYLDSLLISYFPKKMQKEFVDEILSHQLRREIITTVITNNIVNRMGSTYFYRLKENTGIKFCDIARAYVVTTYCFGLEKVWDELMQINKTTPVEDITKVVLKVRKFVEQTSTWLLRHSKNPLNITNLVEKFCDNVARLKSSLKETASKYILEDISRKKEDLLQIGIAKNAAEEIANFQVMTSFLSIIHITKKKKDVDLLNIAKIYYTVGTVLSFTFLKAAQSHLDPKSHWDGLAAQSIGEELYDLQMRITSEVVADCKKGETADETVTKWMKNNSKKTESYKGFITELKHQENITQSMLTVTIQKLDSLIE